MTMANEEKIDLDVNNEEITELTAEEAANVQGGFWWFFSKKKSYATGARSSSTYRA
jgi:hypothetical protein